MPSYVVKVNREDDFYVYWSAIVDAPHTWGTRDEVSRYMRQIGASQDLADRFDRADANGTSAFAYSENYGWDDTGVFIFEQRGMLRRSNLGPFLNSYDHESGEFDLAFLEPFDDEEEVRAYGTS